MFLCLEGIDGAGKSSVAAELGVRLRRSGHDVQVMTHNAVTTQLPFADTYLSGLRALWQASLGQPFQQLGDLHWVLVKASYYAVVDHCVIRPARADGRTGLADGWFYKFAARIASNETMSGPVTEIVGRFAGITPPDRVFLLDVDPRLAASRREDFTAGELGPRRAAGADQVQTFVAYQTAVRGHLRTLATQLGWQVLAAPFVSAEHTAERVMSLLPQASVPPSAARKKAAA